MELKLKELRQYDALLTKINRKLNIIGRKAGQLNRYLSELEWDDEDADGPGKISPKRSIWRDYIG